MDLGRKKLLNIKKYYLVSWRRSWVSEEAFYLLKFSLPSWPSHFFRGTLLFMHWKASNLPPSLLQSTFSPLLLLRHSILSLKFEFTRCKAFIIEWDGFWTIIFRGWFLVVRYRVLLRVFWSFYPLFNPGH